MCESEATPDRTEHMSGDDEVTRLRKRIADLLEKFEKSNEIVARRLTELHTDVKVIKEGSKRRDLACTAHHLHTDKLDISLRGNGKEGILVRLNAMEQRGSGKERFAYTIIGALISGMLALGIALIIKLSS